MYDNLFVLFTLRPAVVEVATGTSWKAIRGSPWSDITE